MRLVQLSLLGGSGRLDIVEERGKKKLPHLKLNLMHRAVLALLFCAIAVRCYNLRADIVAS